MIHTFCGKTPKLGEGSWVAESAQVIGDVELGPRASIWFGCVVRADFQPVRIGEETNIQDLSLIHIAFTKDQKIGTFIGPRVTVGHRAVVHACTVGELCLIGIGAIVMDGAEVGAETVIAAGSLVSPGTKIPPKSLAMGSPARVKRSLTDGELAFLRESAANYVGYANLFKEGR